MTVSHSRRRRGTRSSPRHFVEQSRDVQALGFVGLCGVVSLPQLALEFWPSLDVARRRIRTYYDHKLTNTFVVDSGKPNILSLTRRGVAFIARHDPALAERLRLPGPLRLAGVDHRLAIVDVRLYAAHLSDAGGPNLVAWDGGAGVRAAELGFAGLHLEPDGIATLDDGGHERVAGVEVDFGGESMRGVLAPKLERHARALADGMEDELWMVVHAGEGRVASIHREVERLGLANRAFVLSHADVLRRPVVLPERAAREALVVDQKAAHRSSARLPCPEADSHAEPSCVTTADTTGRKGCRDG